jgi:hypothetical protein
MEIRDGSLGQSSVIHVASLFGVPKAARAVFLQVFGPSSRSIKGRVFCIEARMTRTASKGLRGKPLIDRATYSKRLFFLWAYTILWLVGYIAAIGMARRWSTATNLVVFGLLFFLMPDRDLLFRNYENYVCEWHAENQSSETTSSSAREAGVD